MGRYFFIKIKLLEKEKGILLSSFFWGYLVLQIPSGYLSAIIGGKYFYFIKDIYLDYLY